MLEFSDMSPSHLFRIQLLLLFALLQCVAPLAHAHVNGDNTDHHVHVAAADTPWLNDSDHHDDAVHLSVGEHHSAVVCTPPEYRCSALVIDHPVVTSKQDMFVLRGHAAVIEADYYPPPLPLTPYQLPGSQAPPCDIREIDSL